MDNSCIDCGRSIGAGSRCGKCMNFARYQNEAVETFGPGPNQCDGCAAGIPVVNGRHRMSKSGEYPNYQGCERLRYERDDAGNEIYVGGEPPDDTV